MGQESWEALEMHSFLKTDSRCYAMPNPFLWVLLLVEYDKGTTNYNIVMVYL